MIMIACVDKNMGIGKDGKLIISLKEDMEFFKKKTFGQVVIMGKKTLLSFREQKPLKGRINIVFTHDKELILNYKNFNSENDDTKIYFVNSIIELNEILDKYKSLQHFVIGGESIYKMLIDLSDVIYLTEVDKLCDADTFFPKINKSVWIKEYSEEKKYGDINYSFNKYIRV